MNGLIHTHVQMIFDKGTTTGLTDGELLERFFRRRDQAGERAFEAIVERHGPMVFRVCRGILRDPHEAMDAFQATFFVLARKGKSLWVGDSLAPWLHRVACRTAWRTKGAVDRRRYQQAGPTEWAEALAIADTVAGVGIDHELESAVHEEIDRLPAHYRSTVVLCDLEGLTCDEAASRLGCPLGTVGSRLARGRDRLREQLRRRGLAPKAGNATVAGLAIGVSSRTPLPNGLATAATAAAIRFLTSRAAIQGTAAIIALEVLGTMSMTHAWKAATILLAMSATTTGVMVFAAKETPAVASPKLDEPPKEGVSVPAPSSKASVTYAQAKLDKFRVVIGEAGRLEPVREETGLSMVVPEAKIVSILPDGSSVKKGRLVCELDSSSLQESLKAQEIAVNKANADYQSAKMLREIAELDLKEYVEGVYSNQRLTAKEAIELAKSAINKAEERLKRAERVRERLDAMPQKSASPADIVAELMLDDLHDNAKLGIERERVELQETKNQLELLEKYTSKKIIREFKVEVEKARGLELEKKTILEEKQAGADKIKEDMKPYRLIAGVDGTVSLMNSPNRIDPARPPAIREGAAVRDHQILFKIAETGSPLRVVVRVPQKSVQWLQKGQKAKIKVDAFPNETFQGAVESIDPLPEPTAMFGELGRIVRVLVSIENPHTAIKAGMSAQVEIPVGELDKVLSVPTTALVRYDGELHVAVKKADGTIDWRVIEVGLTGDTAIEVKNGLNEGETIVIAPEPLLSEGQKQSRTEALPRIIDLEEKYWAARLFQKKLRGLSSEDLLKFKQGTPEEVEAVLKKNGFTDEEIRLRDQFVNRNNLNFR